MREKRKFHGSGPFHPAMYLAISGLTEAETGAAERCATEALRSISRAGGNLVNGRHC